MSGNDDPAVCRVVMPEEVGPILVEGPVEVVLSDGRVLTSARPVVALCVCGRSGCFPFCDTSHRRRTRPASRGSQRAGAVGERREQ